MMYITELQVSKVELGNQYLLRTSSVCCIMLNTLSSFASFASYNYPVRRLLVVPLSRLLGRS